MPCKSSRREPTGFSGHSSADLSVRRILGRRCNGAGFDVWLDRIDIRVGVLLGEELQDAIAASRPVVLLWSEAAKASPWVTTETKVSKS